MPEQLVPVLIIVAVVALALVGMRVGWVRRARRSDALGTVAALPADPGIPLTTLDLLYVATTLRDTPYERVAAEGLALRGPATVQAFETGLSLVLAGRDAAWIPAAELEGAARATWTIDRAVEPDGLVRILWVLGRTEVDTYLRPAGPADATTLLDVIQRIARRSVASSSDDAREGTSA